MKLEEAQSLAEMLILVYDIPYTFKFDYAKRRCGQCNYRTRVISLSKHYVQLNSEADIKDTILHEIAHALVGTGHGHNRVWKQKAAAIGCTAKRCRTNVISAPHKHTYVCPNCEKNLQVHRRLKTGAACSICCNKYNFGRYDKKFMFVRYVDGENK